MYIEKHLLSHLLSFKLTTCGQRCIVVILFFSKIVFLIKKSYVELSTQLNRLHMHWAVNGDWIRVDVASWNRISVGAWRFPFSVTNPG